MDRARPFAVTAALLFMMLPSLALAASERRFDVDQDGSVEALSDGIIVLRYLFGLRGESLVSGAVVGNASAAEIEARMAALGVAGLTDVDGDGQFDALTDGLLILRATFGFAGAALTNGAVSPQATRTAEAIATHARRLVTANEVPVARAGSDQSAAPNTVVTLDGAASSDADADALTYQWAIVAQPLGSSLSIADDSPATPTASFTPVVVGTYEIELAVTDAFGARNTDRLTVNVNGVGPTVTISNVLDTLVVDNLSSFTVRGLASSGAGIRDVRVNGALATLANDAWSASVTLQPGANTVTAVATDTLGGTATAMVSIIRDTADPVVTITSPANGASITSRLVRVTGTVSDDSGDVASLFVNSQQVAVTGGAFAVDVGLQQGVNQIGVIAQDRVGNSGVASVLVTVSSTEPDTTAPLITVITPTAGDSFVAGQVLVRARVVDASEVTSVSVNGQSAEPDITGNFFDSAVALSIGQNSIRIEAADEAGNLGSTTFEVTRTASGNPGGTLDLTVVEVAFSTLVPAANVHVILHGSDGSSVQAFDVTDSDGRVTFDVAARSRISVTLAYEFRSSGVMLRRLESYVDIEAKDRRFVIARAAGDFDDGCDDPPVIDVVASPVGVGTVELQPTGDTAIAVSGQARFDNIEICSADRDEQGEFSPLVIQRSGDTGRYGFLLDEAVDEGDTLTVTMDQDALSLPLAATRPIAFATISGIRQSVDYELGSASDLGTSGHVLVADEFPAETFLLDLASDPEVDINQTRVTLSMPLQALSPDLDVIEMPDYDFVDVARGTLSRTFAWTLRGDSGRDSIRVTEVGSNQASGLPHAWTFIVRPVNAGPQLLSAPDLPDEVADWAGLPASTSVSVAVDDLFAVQSYDAIIDALTDPETIGGGIGTDTGATSGTISFD